MPRIASIAVKSAIVAAVAAAATVLNAPTPAADAATFNPDAQLDTSTVVDLRSPQRVQTLTVVPELSVPYVLACQTETGPADGSFRWQSCVPDESPDGGPVDSISEDGSASYRDGWTIAPASEAAAGTVVGTWSEPAPVAPPVRTVAHTSAPRPAAGSCSEPAPVPAGGTTSSTPAPKPQPQPQPQPGGLVNANTATQTQLEAMPHIGRVIAARIVEQRSVRPFASVDDLRHRVSRFPAAAVSLFTV